MTGNLIWYGERILAGAVLALLFVAPPVFVVWRVITGWGEEPLFTITTRTYTTTDPAGLLIEVAPVAVFWLLLIVIVHGVAGGYFPRRIS